MLEIIEAKKEQEPGDYKVEVVKPKKILLRSKNSQEAEKPTAQQKPPEPSKVEVQEQVPDRE